MKHLKSLLFSMCFLIFSLVQTVYAEDIDLVAIPENVGEALGIGTFAGGLICSLGALLPFLIICLALGGRNPLPAMVFIGSLVLCCCVAFTWLDAWVLLFIVFTDICFIAFGGINQWLGGRA